MLARFGWVAHKPQRWRRNFIKRFYGAYPPRALCQHACLQSLTAGYVDDLAAHHARCYRSPAFSDLGHALSAQRIALSNVRLLFAVIVIAVALGGCSNNPFNSGPQQQAAVTQQMQTLAQQNQEFQSRAASLDRDNQEIESLLAQSRQQIQLLTDELTATRSQLQATTGQLVAMRAETDQLRTQSSQLVATVQQRAGAEIRPNNTLLKNLAVTQIPGIEVRQDGDVVRVEVPADRVFMPGSNYLQNGAEQLLESIGADLRRNFPDNIIGIEGHTDDGATHSQQFPTNHHLSAAQALAAYNALAQRGTIPAGQLFVIGHGANHPVVSNASDAGRARNRRIEFVVYPERMARR
jgi:flagellar motor protein MotB